VGSAIGGSSNAPFAGGVTQPAADSGKSSVNIYYNIRFRIASDNRAVMGHRPLRKSQAD
jgi:hypothetical protein